MVQVTHNGSPVVKVRAFNPGKDMLTQFGNGVSRIPMETNPPTDPVVITLLDGTEMIVDRASVTNMYSTADGFTNPDDIK